MSVTLATFKAEFPEFVEAGDTLLQSALDDAAVQVDADVWGAEADRATYLTAAHNLALSPYGRNMRLWKNDPSKTIYGEQLRERMIRRTACLRVG